MAVFFAQTTFMLLGGAAVVAPSGARYLFAGLLTAYELVFVSRLGQTPGKDLLHVKVASHGTRTTPGAERAVRRWLVPLAVVLSPDLRLAVAVVVLSIALALVTPGRRTGHDLLADTWVIAYDADEEEGAAGVDFERLDRLRRRRLFRTEE